MGLLIHWASLSEGDEIVHSGPSWLLASHRWLRAAVADLTEAGRNRVRRFLDLIEANTTGVAEVIELAATGQERAIQNEPEFSLPEDAELSVRFADDILGGIMVIEGEGVRRRLADWEGKLYRPFPSHIETVPIQAIPYCYWANREPGEMLVWIDERQCKITG